MSMRISEYQQLAMRTSPDGHDRVENGCLGLIGESGEIVDLVKKWRYQSGENPLLPAEKLIDECGDVCWYCAELAEGLYTRLSVIRERYGRDHFAALHLLDTGLSLPVIAMRLAKHAIKPYTDLFDAHDDMHYAWQIGQAQIDIGAVLAIVEDILEIWCASSLEDAMEKNAAKLRMRYPDGFDPERSLHRAQ